MGLKPGDRAPEVTLPSHESQQVPLSSLWSEGNAVLFFFPLAFSSTCTEELCNVRDDQGAYAALDARVAGISVDSPYVLKRYREDLKAEYPFFSDFNREASRAFGVLRTAPVGPGLLNAADRAAFVVGRDGVIRYAWHETNPSLLPPFDEIKAALANGE
jgi:peroxiredoxin